MSQVQPAGEDDLALTGYLPWDAVESGLRAVTLLVDRTQRPYAEATIELKRYAVEDLSPIATYVLRPQLELLGRVQTQLVDRYALNLFDVAGMLEYELGGVAHRLITPVVERFYEPTQDRVVSVIVDGLHRVCLARRLDVTHIWVTEISEVPARFPIVSLPLRWEQVREVDSVPTDAAKREFRYASIDDVPAELTTVGLTPENYRYYFYRDLSGLGSGGVRRSADVTT